MILLHYLFLFHASSFLCPVRSLSIGSLNPFHRQGSSPASSKALSVPLPDFKDASPSPFLIGEWVSLPSQSPSLLQNLIHLRRKVPTLRFNLTTDEKVPTVNLNHINGIDTVDCIPSSSSVSDQQVIQVRFKNNTLLANALSKWPNSQDLKLLVLLGNHAASSSKFTCLDRDDKQKELFLSGALQVVVAWKTIDSILVLETVHPETADIHAQYTLILESAVSGNDQSHLSRRETNIFKNSTWSFGFNHTDAVATTKEDGIFIGCNPCAVKGSVGMELKIQGSLFHKQKNDAPKKHDVHLSVSGDLETVFNLTTSMNAQYPRSRITPPINIFWVPFSPMQVPGLLHIGPSFAISLTGVLNMNRGSVTWNTGFEGRIPAFKANLIRSVSPGLESHEADSDVKDFLSMDDGEPREMPAAPSTIAPGFRGLKTHFAGGNTNTSIGFDIKAVFQLSFDIVGQTVFSAVSTGIRFGYRTTLIAEPGNVSALCNTPAHQIDTPMVSNQTEHGPIRIISKLTSNLFATVGPSDTIDLGDELYRKILYDSCKNT